MTNGKPLIIIAGPTAVGKTDLSIALAKKIQGSIISADCMQIYKYMDIGSAKVTPEEMQGIPHYLIDQLDPKEEFHIVKFQEMAKAALEDIYASGRIPIVAGGTGFYTQALLYDIHFTENDADYAFREEMERYAAEHGAEALHEKLKSVDPESYEGIHANNVKRVIRALEYYHLTGQKISEHNETERKRESQYNFAYFVLNDERAHLYSRIDKRVDLMMDKGLLEEVQKLKDMGYHRDMVSMQGIGYKEILDYLNGEGTLEQAIETVKQESRRYAKRQITWFKREKDAIWFDKSQYQYREDAILQDMLAILHEKGIVE